MGNLVHQEKVESEGVEVQIYQVGNTRVELLFPLSGETPVGRFLQKKGEGLHHLAFEVPHLEQALIYLQEQGIVPLEGYPKQGAQSRTVAFLNPKTTGGVLIELIEIP